MNSKFLQTLLAGVLVIAFVPATGLAAKGDALRISRSIRARHMPHGTIIDPTYASPTSPVISHYTRGGDSAIWTGHYLAAEAFRFRVTGGNKKALASAWEALNGIRSLVDVTNRDLLARCRVPVEWEETEDKRAIITEEAGHGVYTGTFEGEASYWIGNTSRDQYVGVFFGLGVAHDVFTEAADPRFRPMIRDLVTRMLDRLLADDWSVRMPNGSISSTFVGRFDQQLALLQLGRHVNPDRFGAVYSEYRDRNENLVSVPILVDCGDEHESYYKFNLDYITMYTLITREEDPSARRAYLTAYRILRSTTRSHGNAHFNLIDRAIEGPDARGTRARRRRDGDAAADVAQAADARRLGRPTRHVPGLRAGPCVLPQPERGQVTHAEVAPQIDVRSLDRQRVCRAAAEVLEVQHPGSVSGDEPGGVRGREPPVVQAVRQDEHVGCEPVPADVRHLPGLLG